MSRRGSVWSVASLCAMIAGCGAQEYPGDKRFAVSGTVTVDGKPLEPGMIAFMPQGAGEGAKGRVAGAPIRNGVYSIPEAKGPTAATYKIEIHWNKPTGKRVKNPMDPTQMIDELTEGLPTRYHRKTELTAEVSAEQTTFNFDLKTE